MRNVFRVNILIADDSIVMQKLIESLMKQYNVGKVVLVNDGLQAAESLKKGTFDILFLDLNMPRYNGFSIANLVKALNLDVHIIAISSDMSAKNITKFSDLGVKYFLPKPLNTTKFKSVVEEILRKTDAKKKEQKAHENDE